MGFGSNLGDRAANFRAVGQAIINCGFRFLRSSPLYESEPWGGAEGANYLNAVLEIERRGEATEFLEQLLAIEHQLGRTRDHAYAPRTCDLDLLLWGDSQIQSTELIVPHPLMTQRRFVLVPLCDLIPDVLHPAIGRTMAELLTDCRDPLAVWRFTPLSSPHS